MLFIRISRSLKFIALKFVLMHIYYYTKYYDLGMTKENVLEFEKMIENFILINYLEVVCFF
jgi:hypothetical protein